MSNMTAQGYLKIAQAYEEEHPDQAIMSCNEAIRLDPLYAEAYFERAKRLRYKHQLDNAFVDLTEAIRINPNYADAYLERGDLLDFGFQDIDGAIVDYTQAIRANPHSCDAYLARALVYYVDKSDYNAALADYTQAIAINSLAYTYHSRAWVYFLKNDFAHAIEDYDKALKLNPHYVDSYLNRGRVKLEQGNFNGAINDFDEAQRVDPNALTSASYWRGYAYDEQNDLEQAIVEYSECIKAIKPTQYGSERHCDALNGRAWSLYCQGNYDQAIQDATQAIELYSFPQQNWLYYHTRGVSYAAKGETAKAIADFQQALALEPYDPEYEPEMQSYIQQHSG